MLNKAAKLITTVSIDLRQIPDFEMVCQPIIITKHDKYQSYLRAYVWTLSVIKIDIKHPTKFHAMTWMERWEKDRKTKPIFFFGFECASHVIFRAKISKIPLKILKRDVCMSDGRSTEYRIYTQLFLSNHVVVCWMCVLSFLISSDRSVCIDLNVMSEKHVP